MTTAKSTSGVLVPCMVLLIYSGCTEFAPAGAGADGYLVRGMASGVAGPASVELHFSGGSELLTVSEDGVFEFRTRFSAGDSYRVELPGREPCELIAPVGSIGDRDGMIELRCGMLLSLEVPSVAGVNLEYGTTEYSLAVSILQHRVPITAQAILSDTTIVVAGQTAENGQPSEPVELPMLG
ncbi:MAG: hypothetical protein AAGC55_14405, partial [Myxococcota bacterium]